MICDIIANFIQGMVMGDVSTDVLLKAVENFDLGSIKGLAKLSPNHFVNLINRSQALLAAQYDISFDQFRPLDATQVQNILSLAQGQASLTLVMRHGEQLVRDEHKNLAADKRKIAMMQMPANQDDGITPASVVELYAQLMLVAYVSGKTGFQVSIESSSNKRASQPAELIATALKSARVQYSPRWQCVNYPNDKTMAKDQLHQYLDKGSLPWNQTKVDSVIGEGTFDTITNNMYGMLQEEVPENTLRLIITHTQQTQALCEALGFSLDRLANYGFIAIPSSSPAQLYSHGVFTSQVLSVLQTPSFFNKQVSRPDKQLASSTTLSLKHDEEGNITPTCLC
jgi:hypothetical protein